LAPIGSKQSLRLAGFGGLVWLLISQFGRMAGLLISTVILARLLDVEDFGVFAMASVVTGALMMFRDGGVSTAVVQAPNLSQEQLSTLFWFVQILAVILAVLAWLASWPVARLFGENEIATIIQVSTVGFLLAAVGVQHDALLRRNLLFKQLAALELASVGISATIAVILGIAGFGWWALVLQRLIQLSAYSLGCWWVCDWRPTFAYKWSAGRADVKFGADVSGFSLVNYAGRNADAVIIGLFLGPVAAGLYRKSFELLLGPLLQLAGPLHKTLLPVLSRLVDDGERYRGAFMLAFVPAFLLLIPPAVTMMVYPQDVVAVLLGPDWLDASPVVRWLGLSAGTQLFSSACGTLLLSQGRSRDFLVAGVVGATLTIFSYLVAVPYGLAVLAATYACGNAFAYQPWLFWWTGRRGAVSRAALHSAQILPGWCAAWSVLGVICLSPWMTDWAPAIRLVIVAAVITAISGLSLLLLGRGRRLIGEVVTVSTAYWNR
jgi:O-antigen/teichoic acid export membrane protein